MIRLWAYILLIPLLLSGITYQILVTPQNQGNLQHEHR
jgi:hypothetical protein